MRGYLSLFLALSTIGCVKVTETVLLYPNVTTDGGISDAGQSDAPTDSGISDAAQVDAAPADTGIADAAPVDSSTADTGIFDNCQLALGVSCAAFEEGYLKASNTDAGDFFGTSVAISGDGNTLAVGAHGEDSSVTGVNGNQADNSVQNSGAVYVFVRSGTTWTQQAYLKASNTGVGDLFGWSVALSGDGNTLAIGAQFERSGATGVNNGQADNSRRSGAAYVFVRNGTTWSQQAYLKASNTGMDDQFGYSVALGGDGSTLAVGARSEDSNATGVNGNPADDSATESGAVYIFVRSGVTWTQQAYLKASNTGMDDGFGTLVALSGDGNTLAVGAAGEASDATGVNGNQADNSAVACGAVYVFVRVGNTWSQQAYVKASTPKRSDNFGFSVALSGESNTLAVGAWLEGSNATGVNGNQADNSAGASGAVYIFVRSGTTWSQQAYVKASNTGGNDRFGASVALSGDGHTLAVGADFEDSNAAGLNGNQANNLAANSGAVYLFRRSGTIWSQQAYVKASNTDAGDRFGTSVTVSSNGTLAVGALEEGSSATGVNGNQADNSALESGAVYVRRIAP